MWQGTTLAAIGLLLVDGYVWKSSLLNAVMGLAKQIAIALGFS
jgi:hypothetical protein